MNSLPGNEEKQYGHQKHPLTLNIYFGKQTVKLKKNFTKVSRVGLIFDFNLYRSINATFKLLDQFSFGSASKME